MRAFKPRWFTELLLALQDIVAGTFKGFAMLRSHATQANKAPAGLEFLGQPAPVYIEGYGFIPPSQVGQIFMENISFSIPSHVHWY
jgi:hypothetical protein